MEQLKMYYDLEKAPREFTLPEGYSISLYKGEEDKLAWFKCCLNGLLQEQEDPVERFDAIMGSVKGLRLTEDIFFLDYGGEHVGTVCGFLTPQGLGMGHMLGLMPEHRGKKLGKMLLLLVMQHVRSLGAKQMVLTTDDWRIPAVTAYLHEGWLPVEYEVGMQDRWQQVLEKVGMDSVQMLYEDATPYQVIYRSGLAKKLRFGVLGAGRGTSMMDYCLKAGNAELVAVCDKSGEMLRRAREHCGDSVLYLTDYEEFLKLDMDCVVLANYANEHAPFAIQALKAGKHVMSEVLPAQTLKEAVELIEAVESSGKIYFYAENYCYMPATRKMKWFMEKGAFGKFEYGEGEYMHNCEDEWHKLTWGDPDHWRNNMSAFYYCTHSTGPIVHISGLRPVKVTGFEAPYNARMARMGAKLSPFCVEMVTMEDGSFFKSLHGVGPARSSIWFSVYGTKGRMESAREDANHGYVTTLHTNCDGREGQNKWCAGETWPGDSLSEAAQEFGHGSADYYTMYNMVQAMRGDRTADIIGVYEAMDMFLPGIFAYRSVLQGGIPVDIPNFRDPAVREQYRNDTECTDPKVAGDMLIPSYSKGNPEIPQETYDFLKSIPENEKNNLDYWNKVGVKRI